MVVWVKLHRGGEKKRPAVVLSSLSPLGLFKVIAGSTGTYNPAIEVELPFDPGGHSITRLTKRTFVSADWIETISVSDILEKHGLVPPRIMEKIWDIVASQDKSAPKPH